MTATFTPDYEVTEVESPTNDRRRKITKFALAGVAVLGIGAALTSAAWTDNVWFGGDASTGDFDLQGWQPEIPGLLDEGWVDAGSAGEAITLPSDAFDAVGPDVADTYTIEVRNNGNITVYLDDPVVELHSDLVADGYTSSFGTWSDTVLEGDETATIDISITGDAGWVQTDPRAEGTVSVQVVGSSEAPTP